jgi:hypothetical protein
MLFVACHEAEQSICVSTIWVGTVLFRLNGIAALRVKILDMGEVVSTRIRKKGSIISKRGGGSLQSNLNTM